MQDLVSIDLSDNFRFSNNGDKKIWIKVFFNFEKNICDITNPTTEYGLKLQYYQLEKRPVSYEYSKSGIFPESWWSPLINFVGPYVFSFYDEKDNWMFDHKFDLTMKLVLLNLCPRNDLDLYVWLCAIKKFKDLHNCFIAIRGDNNQENLNENIVNYFGDTISFNLRRGEDIGKEFYASFDIGWFFDKDQSTKETPVVDWVKNPDGHDDKTALDIINDVLFFEQNLFSKKFLNLIDVKR
jgi:hypothetical protein